MEISCTNLFELSPEICYDVIQRKHVTKESDMDRKAVARETLKIMDQGYYEYEGKRIDIQSDMDASIRSSVLITPTQGAELLEKYSRNDSSGIPDERVA